MPMSLESLFTSVSLRKNYGVICVFDGVSKSISVKGYPVSECLGVCGYIPLRKHFHKGSVLMLPLGGRINQNEFMPILPKFF